MCLSSLVRHHRHRSRLLRQAPRDLIARLPDVEHRLSPQRKLGDIADADHTPLLPDRIRRGGPTYTLVDQAEIDETGIGINVDRNNILQGSTHQFGWPGNLTIDAIARECLDARYWPCSIR
jgi:hypothetical protein